MPYKKLKDRQESWRRSYRNNPEVKVKANARRARYRQRNMAILREEKDRPCMDCLVSFPYYVMDFDHLDGEDKIGLLTQLAWRPVSVARLREEIAKCEVVCSNCHRMRTYRRRVECGLPVAVATVAQR